MLYGTRLRALSILAAVTLTAGFGLAFFYAPMDADQGFMQKIFYVHVPLAIVALCGFVFGGVMAIQHLRTRDPRYDLRSYVAIHLSLVLGAGVLVTGAIWAKASWGHWWVWDEPTLVSFLVVFLLYATYQPLRFSIEDPERDVDIEDLLHEALVGVHGGVEEGERERGGHRDGGRDRESPESCPVEHQWNA